ncbi:MAG: C39 family peptidase [Cyanobacteriota bacterium]
MSVSGISSSNQALIAEAQKSFSNDGRLDKKEVENLKTMINSSNLSTQAKDGAIKFLEQTKKSSDGFLGIFGKNISNSELGKLKELANSLGDNPIAKELSIVLENSFAKPSGDSTKISNHKTHSSEPADSNVSKLFSEKKSSTKNTNISESSSSASSSSASAQQVCSTKESKNPQKWHTCQYDEYGYSKYYADHGKMKAATGGNSPKAGLAGQELEWRKAYSSCGPASLSMVLKAKGFSGGNLANIREKMGERMYAATDVENFSKGVKALSGGKLKAEVLDKTKSNVNSFLNTLRNEISKGNMPIMLSAFINNDGTHGGTGHYMVVNSVNKDGSIVVSDPTLPSSNPTRVISLDALTSAFNSRKNHTEDNQIKEGNVIISISGNSN